MDYDHQQNSKTDPPLLVGSLGEDRDPSSARSDGQQETGAESDLGPLASPRLGTFLKKHAILPEIAAARPYRTYTTDDVSVVREAYAALGDQLGYMIGLATQVDGIIFDRHPAPGCDHVYAQMRPTSPVRTAPPTWHFHPDSISTAHEREVVMLPDGSCGVFRTPASTVTWKSGEPVPDPYRGFVPLTVQPQEHIDNEKYVDSHDGKNSQVVHFHENLAKYLFPPSPKKVVYWEHDHAQMSKGRRIVHELKKHGGERVVGPHQHERRVIDYDDESRAKRIDLHPFALEMIEKARVVFFVIEGTIKADAILSAGEAVFSVPSVSLWDADELEDFADRHLRSKEIVVVCDSDWNTKEQVIHHARCCQDFLRRRGFSACVAAPPLQWKPKQSKDEKGVDDFLRDGGRLEGLIVIGREPPVLDHWKALETEKRRHTRGRWREGLERDLATLGSLAMHANPEGKVIRGLRTTAKILGFTLRNRQPDQKKVARSIESLERHEAITVDGSLDVRHNFLSGQLEWVKRPTITIREDLRATDIEEAPLAQWLAQKGIAMTGAQQAEVVAVIERAKRKVVRYVEETFDHEVRTLQLDPHPTDSDVSEAVDDLIRALPQ